MDTEKNHKNKPTDKPKEADAALIPKTIKGQDDKIPAKKIKRQGQI